MVGGAGSSIHCTRAGILCSSAIGGFHFMFTVFWIRNFLHISPVSCLENKYFLSWEMPFFALTVFSHFIAMCACWYYTTFRAVSALENFWSISGHIKHMTIGFMGIKQNICCTLLKCLYCLISFQYYINHIMYLSSLHTSYQYPQYLKFLSSPWLMIKAYFPLSGDVLLLLSSLFLPILLCLLVNLL
jgi:hypothetical protein